VAQGPGKQPSRPYTPPHTCLASPLPHVQADRSPGAAWPTPTTSAPPAAWPTPTTSAPLPPPLPHLPHHAQADRSPGRGQLPARGLPPCRLGPPARQPASAPRGRRGRGGCGHRQRARSGPARGAAAVPAGGPARAEGHGRPHGRLPGQSFTPAQPLCRWGWAWGPPGEGGRWVCWPRPLQEGRAGCCCVPG